MCVSGSTLAAYDKVSGPQIRQTSFRSSRPAVAKRSTSRNQTCLVESHNDGKTDDSQSILDAVEACNPGGHVLFPASQSYFIGAPMDLTGLSNVDLDIQGSIQFSDNMTYWRAGNMFQYDFQNATSFFKLGGTDVNVYGGGVLEGNGQVWWEHYPENKKDQRPVLFAMDGLSEGSVSDLELRNSPFWHNFVANSTEVVFTNISIRAISANYYFPKNTDGWDIYRSSRITVQNSSVTNGDGKQISLC